MLCAQWKSRRTQTSTAFTFQIYQELFSLRGPYHHDRSYQVSPWTSVSTCSIVSTLLVCWGWAWKLGDLDSLLYRTSFPKECYRWVRYRTKACHWSLLRLPRLRQHHLCVHFVIRMKRFHVTDWEQRLRSGLHSGKKLSLSNQDLHCHVFDLKSPIIASILARYPYSTALHYFLFVFSSFF